MLRPSWLLASIACPGPAGIFIPTACAARQPQGDPPVTTVPQPTTPEPQQPAAPVPPAAPATQSVRRLWIAYGGLAVCGVAYVLLDHPGLAGLVSALGGAVSAMAAVVMALRR